MKKLLLILMLVSVVSGGTYTDKKTDSLVLTNCTEDTSLTNVAGKWYMVSGQPLMYDANGYSGNRGIEAKSINNILTQARLFFLSAQDISNYDLIKISYKIEDTCRNNSLAAGTYDFRLNIMTSGAVYNQYYVTTRGRVHTIDNWYTVTLPINRPNSVAGTPDLSNINYVAIMLQNAASKGAVSLTIGKISVCKSALTTGYFTISLDGAESTMLSLGLPVFQRYNCKPMLYHIPSRVGVGWEPTYMSWAQVDSLYRLGWEIGHMGYSHANFDTCSAEQIRTEIQLGYDTLAAHGYVHRDFFAVPNGHKTRKADTVATEYTFVRRGVNGLLDVPSISSDQVYAPMFTGKYVTNGGILQNDTSETGRWNTVKIAIDSAVARKSVSGIIIHRFRTSASVEHGAVMDTATLDTMLHYLDSLKIAGVIDYGSISRLFTPPPAVIAVQPVSDTVIAGQAATFFVTSYSDSVTYQWYRNDSLIAGATNDTFTYTSRSQVGNYTDNIYCLLTTDTTISTDTVQLLVNGIVFRQSTDTLKLVCSNNQNVESWQWYKNNVSISGATDSVLSVVVDSTSVIKSVYYCEISNGVENKKVGDWMIERKANGRVVSRKNKYK